MNDKELEAGIEKIRAIDKSGGNPYNCFTCGKPMTKQVDRFTGEISNYLYRCEDCTPPGLIINIG